ncbi:contactin-2-like [Haliotis rubra]|uniref:contactin-2-like n=1 Tax=Haliotis rubra TaxID=36100 RepID=UPI001EE55AF1|nr:contactin-2-like [Haliotis rubra]XP_046567800.1 contactin-2-like [Haliotis rubra]
MGKMNLKLTLIAMTTVYQIAANQWNAPLLTKNVTGGQSVSMTCRDPPKGRLSWYKIDEAGTSQISNDRRKQTDQKGTLHFVYVEVTDTGKYKCGSSIGSSINLGSPVQLNVKEGETNSNVPVKLLRSTGNTSANLGEDVTLECIFGGRPIPTVSWFHQNRKLSNSDSLTISNSSITIKQVSKTDTGIYSCSGNNNDGEESATMNLNVIDPNEVPPSTRGHRETKLTTLAVGKTDIGTAKPNPAIEAGSAGSGTVSATGVVVVVAATLWLL